MKKTKRIDVRMTELDYERLVRFASYFGLSKSKILLLAFKFSNLNNLKTNSDNQQIINAFRILSLIHNAYEKIESINSYLDKITTYEGVDTAIYFTKKIRQAMKQANNSLNDIKYMGDDIIDQYESRN